MLNESRANLVRYPRDFWTGSKVAALIVPSPPKSEAADTTCRNAHSASRPRADSFRQSQFTEAGLRADQGDHYGAVHEFLFDQLR